MASAPPNTIPSYPPPARPLDGSEPIAGWQDGRQVAVLAAQLAALGQLPTQAVIDALTAYFDVSNRSVNDRITAAVASLTASVGTQLAAAALFASTADASAQSAALSAISAGSYPNAAASYVPKGVTAAAISAAGSGGANGTFALAFSGGNFTINPTGTFAVSGGIVTAVNVTGPGLFIGASPTPPTPSVAASAGLTGATVSLTTDVLIASGRGYWVESTDGLSLVRYRNNAGAAAPDAGVGGIPNFLVDPVAITDDYDNILSIEVDNAGSFISWRNINGEALGRLGLDIVVSNGLTLTFDPTTGREKLAYGTAEGSVTIAPGILTFADDYDGYADLYLDANGNVITSAPIDGSGNASGEVSAARGNRGSLDTRISQNHDAYGNPKSSLFGGYNLRDWRYRRVLLMAGASPASIVQAVVGDSWTELDPAYFTMFYKLMIAKYGDGGLGWIPFNASNKGPDASKATITATGTWTGTAGNVFTGRGPMLKEYSSSAAGANINVAISLTYAATFKLHYLLTAGGGSFQWRVNGGAWTVVSTANASDALGLLTITPPVGAFNIDFQIVSGTVTLFGGDHRNTATPGYVAHRLGAIGATAADWITAGPVRLASWAALGVDLWTVLLGSNDQAVVTPAVFNANLTTLVGLFRGVTAGADVLLTIPFENNNARPTPMALFRDAMMQCAADNRCAMLDLVRMAGSISEYTYGTPRGFFGNTDGLHPVIPGWAEVAGGMSFAAQQ